MRTSDASIANDIYAGYFVFAGRALATGGRSPFTMPQPSRAWAEILYGFGWLRHLRAADTALARANARSLVDEYLSTPQNPVARRPEVTARRVMSFLSQSPLIVEGAEHAFYQRLMRNLGRDIRILASAMHDHPRPLARLIAAVALCYAGLSLEGFGWLGRRATRVLGRELDRQVLPDGGHVGRNPKVVLELLLDLLPLRQAYLARGLEPPEALMRAIDRIPPMLRLLRHGDGTLALFNGMGSTPVDHLTTLLFYDEARANPLQRGLVSGYERLEAEGALVIVDAGAAPPTIYSAEAGAGPLSFEMSSRGQRMIVNCGAPRDSSAPIAQLTRATAAHSTLTIDDASCARFLGARVGAGERALSRWLVDRIGPVIVSGAKETTADRHGPLRLKASHDGYVEAFGLLHERRLELSAAGDRLEGEDRLTPVNGQARNPPALLRFHLHPGVAASLTQGGRVVMLVLPSRETWQFVAGDRVASLEESIFLAATDGARRSTQIVVPFDAEDGQPVSWRLERLSTGQPPD